MTPNIPDHRTWPAVLVLLPVALFWLAVAAAVIIIVGR